MSARDDILRAVRSNAPDAVPLPAPSHAPEPRDRERVRRFRTAAAAAGAAVRAGPEPDGGLAAVLGELFPDAQVVASMVGREGPAGGDAEPPEGARRVDLTAIRDPHALADLDVVVFEAALGVAENGAVWLPESRLGHRAAPFLAQHVLVVLDPAAIVDDMHDAYARVSVDEEGFGLFMAGPSKTADIEQSLVIGAHGPRSLTVLLPGEAP
jgi:L-lactate dehydrogenase complex protein LldG